MARNGDVNISLRGDPADVLDAFSDVSGGAKTMSKDIDRATGDSKDGFDSLSSGVDASEGKFRGFGDTIGGTSDIMEGFKTGNLAGVAMGFADLAGGLSDFVLPALTAVRGFVMTSLLPALTAIATHPVFIAIAVGGAIILGLILLEKKFGLVSTALGALRDVAAGVFETVSRAVTGAVDLIRTGWNATVGGKGFSFGGVDLPGPLDVPGFSLHIPKLHTGGVVPGHGGQDVLTRLQAGETVLARGQGGGGGVTINVGGSVITERDLGRIVADALRQNKLIGVS